MAQVDRNSLVEGQVVWTAWAGVSHVDSASPAYAHVWAGEVVSPRDALLRRRDTGRLQVLHFFEELFETEREARDYVADKLSRLADAVREIGEKARNAA